jgi:Rifampin ADP-ribosyl transferase
VTNPVFPGRSFFHGTKVNLKQGDLITAGYSSNYGKRAVAAYVYLSGTLNAAIWGAELAFGHDPGRIYVVEATGPIEDDPDLTDRKFPGNPTLSYRSKDPLRVIGEVIGWEGHSVEELTKMKANVERVRQQSIESTQD